MGTDTPIAVLSERPRIIFDYFTQLFAQVTNPPLDAIREELVTSLGSSIGPEGNVLAATPAHARQVVLPFPVIDNDELAKIVHINADGDLPGYSTVVVKGTYDVHGGEDALRARLHEIFAEVSAAIQRRRPLRRALRPRLRPRPRADPVAAAHLRRAPPPDPREDPHPGRPRRRGRRRARGAPRGPARRLRRGRDQPLPRDGDRRGHGAARRHHRGHRGEGGRQPDQGARQGRAQGDVEDGHLDGGLLPRRPGLRGDRPVAGARRRVLHRHGQPARRGGPRRHRGRGRGPARRPPTRPTASGRRTASCSSAASTSGAARASRTCSTPTPSSGCSTPPGPGATTSSSSTPRGSTSSPAG